MIYLLATIAALLVLITNTWRLMDEDNIFIERKDEKYVHTENLAIRYRTYGDANSDYPTVFMLHGFNVAGIKEWDYLLPHLDKRYYYVYFDLPGMGLSERFTQSEKPTIDFQLGLFTTVIKKTKLQTNERIIIISASYGSTLGTAFVLENPDLIEKFIPISPLYSKQGGALFATIGNLPLGIGSGFTFLAMGAGPISNYLYSSASYTEYGFSPSNLDKKERLEFAKIRGTTESFMLYSRYQQEIKFYEKLPLINTIIHPIFGEKDPYEESDKLESIGIASITIPLADHTPHLSMEKKTGEQINGILKTP